MKTKFTKSLSSLLALLLTLCTLLSVVGCGNDGGDTDTTPAATTTTAPDAGDKETPNAKRYNITFTVVHGDGTSKDFSISTDEEMLGDALLAEGLISGEDGYIKVVDGERADYDTDGAYWAFYIGEEYAMTGVDATKLTDGGIYSFVYTKG